MGWDIKTKREFKQYEHAEIPIMKAKNGKSCVLMDRRYLMNSTLSYSLSIARTPLPMELAMNFTSTS